MSGHRQYECKHGRIVMQCRCPGPHEVRLAPCLPTCPVYDPKHASALGVQVLGCYPNRHNMVPTSSGSLVFSCSACGRVNVQPLAGPSPGQHRKVNA